jgi:hypothetical protein
MCPAAEETIRKVELQLLDLLKEQACLRARILHLRDSRLQLRESKMPIPFLATLGEKNQSPPARIALPCVVQRSTKLRRACRIALCEAEDPESAPQIVARITARNSYLFPEGIDPASAIVPELKRLVLQGQAYFTSREGVRIWGWQRS